MTGFAIVYYFYKNLIWNIKF